MSKVVIWFSVEYLNCHHSINNIKSKGDLETT